MGIKTLRVPVYNYDRSLYEGLNYIDLSVFAYVTCRIHSNVCWSDVKKIGIKAGINVSTSSTGNGCIFLCSFDSTASSPYLLINKSTKVITGNSVSVSGSPVFQDGEYFEFGVSAASSNKVSINPWDQSWRGGATHYYLYSLKLYGANDVLLGDFCPVRELSTGHIGLWDNVSKTALFNAVTSSISDHPKAGANLEQYMYYPGVTNENDTTDHGKVDLGTFAWAKNTYGGSVNVFEITGSVADMNGGNWNLYVPGYGVNVNKYYPQDMADMTVKNSAGKSLCIRDDAKYAAMTAAEFQAAMSGKYLYYQRTSDATWNPPFWAFLQGGNT